MSVIANDVNPGRVGVGGQHFFVEPAGTLRIHPPGFIQVDWGRGVGVAGGVAVHPLAAANNEQGSFFTYLAPSAGATLVVGRMGRIDEVDHRFPGFGLHEQRGRGRQKSSLRHRVGFAGQSRGQFAGGT